MRSISRAETESCRSNLRSAVPDKSRDSSRPENINFRLVVRQRTFVFQINNDSVCAFFNLSLGLKRLFREASQISDKLFLPFKAWQGYLLSSHKLLSPMFFYGYVHHVVRQHFSGSALIVCTMYDSLSLEIFWWNCRSMFFFFFFFFFLISFFFFTSFCFNFICQKTESAPSRLQFLGHFINLIFIDK